MTTTAPIVYLQVSVFRARRRPPRGQRRSGHVAIKRRRSACSVPVDGRRVASVGVGTWLSRGEGQRVPCPSTAAAWPASEWARGYQEAKVSVFRARRRPPRGQRRSGHSEPFGLIAQDVPLSRAVFFSPDDYVCSAAGDQPSEAACRRRQESPTPNLQGIEDNFSTADHPLMVGYQHVISLYSPYSTPTLLWGEIGPVIGVHLRPVGSGAFPNFGPWLLRSF